MRPNDRELIEVLRAAAELMTDAPARTGGSAYLKAATIQRLEIYADALSAPPADVPAALAVPGEPTPPTFYAVMRDSGHFDKWPERSEADARKALGNSKGHVFACLLIERASHGQEGTHHA